MPSHRSIAEYLAARWLARSINNNGLPTKRVLNLLLGCDGCAVAGLRGLYGWLALHSQVARTNLIETDPLTVVVYGDVKPMPITDKRSILAGLRREAESFRAFHREVEAVHPFGALADAELQEDFLAILNSPERDDASQSHTDCVLDVLVEGEALPKLAPALLRIAHDDTRWPRIKHSALKAWLSFIDDPQIKLALLEDINTRRVSADDDELMGMLLSHLYPSHIDPKTLLRYLHTPKIPEFIGKYHWFWTYELVQAAPCDHLSILLDGLIGRSEIQSKNGTDDRFDTMVDSLLACGLTKLDENITDQQLFSWLGLGADKYGHIQREHKKTQIIANWLSMRPERYKAVLDLCFKECEGTENYSYCIRIQTNRLHNAILPHDLGLWHLEQVARTMNDGLAILHLSKTVDALGDQRCTAGLSFKQLEDWGLANPTRKHWLDPLLSCEIPDWRSQEAARKIAQQKESKNAKQSRTDWITQYLNKAEIVPHHVLYELARIWMGPFNEFKGETPIERFNDYCVHGQEALTTAEIEFQRCLVYSDLPTVDQIIDFSKNNQAHYIRLPCLIGIKLLWQRNTKEIERLPAETLRRMIAFLLTSGDDNKPAWFIHVVQQYPELVADVLIAYACATWKAGKDYVNNIFPPDYDSRYRAVAISAIPRLLASFPLRARSVQLRTLRQVLEAALRYQLPDVAALIRKRIAIKGMDVPQRIYWLATASLLHPMNGEKALWLYIGKSHIRASHLSGFLSNYEGKLNAEYQFSASTIGTLIEVIGPHIATAWPHGASWETDATRSSDQVRAFIIRLGAMATSEAAEEIDRLLRLFSHEKLKPLLENARYQLKLRQREKEFRFLPPPQVAQVLANQEPASTSDLAALTLDHLDVIARDIRQDNDDGFRAFWNVEKRYPTNQRDENLFRDALLTRLRGRLDRSSVECQPEGDYANDKRADLRVSFRNKFEVPIEIKRDSNEGLWTSLKGQLINQYAVSPRAHGYGIYLVLWFDGQKIPRPTDGTTKPTSPDELKTRLEAQLDPVELQRISVRVLDVSWPTNTPLQSTSTTKP